MGRGVITILSLERAGIQAISLSDTEMACSCCQRDTGEDEGLGACPQKTFRAAPSRTLENAPLENGRTVLSSMVFVL